ncbi:MAG: hypothetical protein U1E27_11475, partial [Kiritimatiellia bacterium]|nr:hypothetical protein [Kiritimatiellia bacterium]
MSLRTHSLPLKKRVRKQLGDSFMRQSIARAQDLINGRRAERYAELGNAELWRAFLLSCAVVSGGVSTLHE